VSTVIVDDGALVAQDPADQRVYTVDWTKHLALGVAINTSTFAIRALNAAAAALFKTVASWVYDGGVTVTVTTTTPHGYTAFVDFVTISGANEPDANHADYVISVVSPTIFTLGLSSPSAFTATGAITAAIGLDAPDVDAGGRLTWVRVTNATRGARYEITNHIVTDDTPAQTKERSFQLLIEDL
jgi:hypothetical protein